MRLISSIVIGWAEDIATREFNTPGVPNLFRRAGLGEFVPPSSWSRSTLADQVVRSALAAAAEGDEIAKNGLNEFVRLVALKVAPRTPDFEIEEGSDFWRLREAARSDGFDLRADFTVGDDPQLTGVRVLPLDEPKMPLSDEITALEDDFIQRDLKVALNHYRQAVTNFVDQNFEAANGQLRAMLEAVIVHSATTTGFTSTKQGDGGRAIRWLVDNGHLPAKDGGGLVQGLWDVIHTNGSHPGTTNAGEVHVRMLTTTGVARYLLDRFQ